VGVYMTVPKASHTTVEVATTAALKTVLQLATPSTTDICILGWGVSFDGISASAAPGVVELIDTNVAATVTTLTPEKWGSDLAPASLCVGGAALTGYNASAEGTITASRILDSQNVHPQTGYSIWFPDASRAQVQQSRFLRIRTTFAATVNCIPWIVHLEPAR
jgi:hypothetical protein